jgi:hypothetical protein
MEREGGKTQYFCRSYSLAPVQPCEVDQNENRRIVHFIILTLETLVKIIARKDEGKGDRDRMRRKHDRTWPILPKNICIDNFLNDEHQQYLQYFQANPTIMCQILM